MLKRIALALLVLVVLVLAYAATLPDLFKVERSTTVAAPPAAVYALVEDFRRWPEWSPYEKLDPALQRTLSGASSGTGAVYEWKGNDQVGQGRMEITEATPPSRVAIKLDFLRPFEAHNVAEFTMTPQAAGTQVTWAMHGVSSYFAKVLSVFVDFDRLVGKDFETGLANLKALAEKT